MSDDLFDPDQDEARAAEDFRAKLEESAKREKAQAKRLQELEARVAESDRKEREAKAIAAFQESGLDPSWSNLYLKDSPDAAEIDTASVVEWAQQYNLAPKSPEPPAEQVETPSQPQPPAPQPFQPMVQGQGGVDQEISYEEYKAAVNSGDADRQAWAVDLSQRDLVRR